MKTILVIDDDPMVIDILNSFLVHSYRVIAAKDGRHGLSCADSNDPPDLILLDVLMPGLDGYEVCGALKENPRTHDIPVIFISVLDADYDETRGFKLGAVDYITKPFSPAIIQARIRTHLALSKAHHDLQSQNERLEAIVEERTRSLQKSEIQFRTLVDNIPGAIYRCSFDAKRTMRFISNEIAEIGGHSAADLINNKVCGFTDIIHPDDRESVAETINKAVEGRHPYLLDYRIVNANGETRWVYEKGQAFYENDTAAWLDGAIFDATVEKLHEQQLIRSLRQAIQAVALTVEKRDPYTSGHQRRTSVLATDIARTMGLDSDVVEGVRMGALIHDIGKIYVPSEILNRPGKLTEPEFKIIQTHPEVGYEIIANIELPWPVKEMIQQHHERLDGSGYPCGLKGGEVILEARILAVADVVEAMASHRPYRVSLGIDAALTEIRQQRGILYDLEVVDACLELFKDESYILATAD